jgi:hypothetical protein
MDMSQKEWQRCLQQQLEPVLTAPDSGVGLSTYTDMPFGIFLYPPEDEWELRQALRDLVVRLENAGKTVQRLSMAQLLEQSIARFGDAEEGRKFYDNLQPIGHLGEPEDIANGALYLASDESRFVTGAELVIDGGFTAR